jgi:hypothetical protein
VSLLLGFSLIATLSTIVGGGLPGSAQAVTERSFAFNGALTDIQGAGQDFVVPAGVSSIRMIVDGASGFERRLPGLGGRVDASVPVVPGETLRIFVGGSGANNGTRNGGGATDVRRAPYGLANRLVVGGGAAGGSALPADTAECAVTGEGGSGGFPGGEQGGSCLFSSGKGPAGVGYQPYGPARPRPASPSGHAQGRRRRPQQGTRLGRSAIQIESFVKAASSLIPSRGMTYMPTAIALSL